MNATLAQQQPEREHTDESLREERTNSDKALLEKQALGEKSADDRVEHDRDKADTKLVKTRVKADEDIDSSESGGAKAAVARERQQADQIRNTERSTADKGLKKDRQEQAATLAALLPTEREKTDLFLQTERLHSDDALAQRDDFLGMVSHDLRDLLHGMVLNANLLLATATATEEGRQSVAGLQQIQQSATRMNRLIGDLLDVVSIEAGRLSVQPDAGDAARLIAEAVSGFALAAADKQVTIYTELIQPALEAEFDEHRLLQVLNNLLSNAIKFTPAGGIIKVRGECSERELKLMVSDTGKGIPAEEIEKIFERFRQVGKPDGSGFGLGLYVSRCIVESHGGRLWAESKPGEGSTFYVSLPRRSGRAGA